MSSGINAQTPQKKITKRRLVRFCVVVSYVDRLLKTISKILGNRVPVTSKGKELDNVTSYLESMLIKTSALMNKLNNYVRN